MHRVKVPAGLLATGSGAVVDIDDVAALRHLRDVLRLKPGASVELFDGTGRVGVGVLNACDMSLARFSLGEVKQRPFVGVAVTLAQGLPKGDKLELVIQKAVELGVAAVVPLACERSVVKLDPRKAADRVDRWQKIADEAARQCGRADSPVVRPVQSFASYVSAAASPGEVRLLLDEDERELRLRSQLVDPAAHHICVIGPEGGLSRDEAAQARLHGYVPVTLGPRVLRTETVGLAVLSVIQHVLGDFG